MTRILILPSYTRTIVGNQWPPYAWDYGKNSFLHNGVVFPNKSPHFKAGMHKAESTNVLNSTVNFVVANYFMLNENKLCLGKESRINTQWLRQ